MADEPAAQRSALGALGDALECRSDLDSACARSKAGVRRDDGGKSWTVDRVAGATTAEFSAGDALDLERTGCGTPQGGALAGFVCLSGSAMGLQLESRAADCTGSRRSDWHWPMRRRKGSDLLFEL